MKCMISRKSFKVFVLHVNCPEFFLPVTTKAAMYVAHERRVGGVTFLENLTYGSRDTAEKGRHSPNKVFLIIDRLQRNTHRSLRMC